MEENKNIAIKVEQQNNVLFQDVCQIIEQAVQLIKKYGDSFSRRNLYHYLDFYKSFPYFFHAVSGKPIEEQIVNTARSQSGDNLKNILNSLRSQSPIRLSWTHYRIILQENTDRGRVWYEQEAAREMWSTRTLQRNVSRRTSPVLQTPSSSSVMVRSKTKRASVPSRPWTTSRRRTISSRPAAMWA